MLDILKQAALSSRDDVMAVLQYVLTENKVLREKFTRRVPLSAQERRILMLMARAVPRAFDAAIGVAGAKTVRGWGRPRRPGKKKTGRPMTDAEIEALVLRIAEESETPIGAPGIYRRLKASVLFVI